MSLIFDLQQSRLGLTFNERLSIYTVSELKAELDTQSWPMDNVNECDINLSAVEQMDSAGVQLVLALQQFLKAQGIDSITLNNGEESSKWLALLGSDTSAMQESVQ